MNVVTNKAIVIGVAIFITVAITSAIFVSIGLMRDVYSDVYETDIAISSGFGEFDEFDGTEKTGLDLLNVLNKYYGSNNVIVNVTGKGEWQNKDKSIIDKYDPSNNVNNGNKYNTQYKCEVDKSGDNTIITFTKK